MRYKKEVLDEEEDNGTMPNNVEALGNAVIGHRIVKVEKYEANDYFDADGAVITLDNGKRVKMIGGFDCCAYTELNEFLLHPEMVNHMIMGVGTTDGYTRWHIYADAGDILELTVGWSAGNPFYYGYGFDIYVEDIT